MVIIVFNTLTNKKERLRKSLLKPIRLFVCGQTVYDHAHLGHARTYVVFDVIVRYLRYSGFKIKYIQNITDIDDKIIERSKERKQHFKELAQFFMSSRYAFAKNWASSLKCCLRSFERSMILSSMSVIFWIYLILKPLYRR